MKSIQYIYKKMLFLNNIIIIIKLSLALCFVTSCSKNSFIENRIQKTVYDKPILKFASIAEFLKTYHVLATVKNSDNYKQIKYQNNFISEYEKIIQFYQSINFDQFSSSDDLIQFVLEHSNYLKITIDESGEKTIDPVIVDNPFKYFANEDFLFQIGDSVYKVLGRHTIGSDLSKLNNFIQLNEEHLIDSAAIDDYFIFSRPTNDFYGKNKDNSFNCNGTWKDSRNTVANNRIYLRISLHEVFKAGSNVNPSSLYQFTDVMIRPYHRVLGIWYWAKRTISYDVKVQSAYFHWNIIPIGWQRYYNSAYSNGTYAYSVEFPFPQVLTYHQIGGQVDVRAHFDGYFCKAKTPDTDWAFLECNTALIP